MLEKQTRQEIIDKRLKKAGWDVENPAQVTAEHEVFHQVGTTSGIGYSDYVLLDQAGSPIALVEAKKTASDAREGREQAKQYADGIEKEEDRRPFIFYTNGYDIYFWNDVKDIPRKIYGFLTLDDLSKLFFQRRKRLDLSSLPINKNIAGRSYQIQAIKKVAEHYSLNQRNALLVMATGTGKTRTAIAIVDLLQKANWLKRVLFLADRNALLRQAKRAFTEFMPHSPRHWIKQGKLPLDQRIYFSTYPSMMTLYHKISVGFFDLIICDESHRSIYNKYRDILSHFYSYKLGLTATPVEHIDRNTFQLFEVPKGQPTFNFSYEDALKSTPPYLTPYKVLNIQSRFQIEGIKASKLPLHLKKQLVEEGKDLEAIDFKGTDLERRVTNSGTNSLIVREFMKESIKDENGVAPGKSIIFAISHNHALRLEEAFNKLYPQYKGKLVRVIDSHDSRASTEGGLLDQFKDPKNPLKVAISVDMLDTGIDVREVVNLVFAKPVFSRAKFWQMIGRGTRLCPGLFGKDQDKKEFLIIDHWNNFSYFDMNPEGKEPSPSVSLPEQLFLAKLKKASLILSHSLFSLKEKVIKDLREDIQALNMESLPVKERARQVAEVKESAFWKSFNQESIDFLQRHISPIMSSRNIKDFHALWFDIDILKAETALISKDEKALEQSQKTIQKKISELPLTLNQVRTRENIIAKAKSNKFWTNLSETAFENLRQELRCIMKYRNQGEETEIEKLNLEDMTLIKKKVEFGPEREQASVEEYRKKLEFKVRSLLSENEVLKRLKAGEEIDDVDIENLAYILQSEDPYITLENLKTVYENQKLKFINFIKHILGLEKIRAQSEVIEESFDRFIKSQSDLSSKQMQFLQILKTFVVERGQVFKEELVSPPFTNLHSEGIRGLFNTAQTDEILNFISTISE